MKNKIDDSNHLIKVIKNCKGIMRLLVIKRTNPEQWHRVLLLDGVCTNPAVLEDAKTWLPFIHRVFKQLIPDLTYEEVEKTFMIAYVNSWGFHIPGLIFAF